MNDLIADSEDVNQRLLWNSAEIVLEGYIIAFQQVTFKDGGHLSSQPIIDHQRSPACDRSLQVEVYDGGIRVRVRSYRGIDAVCYRGYSRHPGNRYWSWRERI